MEAIVFIAFLSWAGLACLVGWVTNQRGRGFALGFWVSAIFSPLIGLLVAIALADLSAQSSTSAAKTGAGDGAVRAWQLIETSLDPGEYVDFITANQGHELAVQAARHKRLLEQWQSLDQRDGQAIERFISAGVFPSLATEVRRVVEENSAISSSVSEYLQRVRTKEQAEREQQEELDREAELARTAERRRAETEAKSNSAKVRRNLLGALGVLVFGVLAVVGFYWFQAFSLQKRIDDKTLACKQLEDKSRETANEHKRLVEPLNKSLTQLSDEKGSLDRKWSERIRTESAALSERAAKSIRAMGRYSYGDLSVTVSNGSPYCLWRAGEYSFSSSPEGPVVTLYQGATSLGRADPEYSYQVTNAEDRYGFSKGCFIPPGTSRSFDVSEPSASSPGARKRAEAEGLRLRGDYDFDKEFVVDRVTPENLHFFELRSSTSGNRVDWNATPVDWRKLAEEGLVNEDAARTAELSAQMTKLSADIEALPIKAALAEAGRQAAQCQSELTDLVRPPPTDADR